MIATIGVYSIYDLAMKAFLRLNDFGFTGANLTLMRVLPAKDVGVTSNVYPANSLAPIWYGADPLFRTTFRTFKRISVLAMPGEGFLFAAGALAGMVAGFDSDLMADGISVLFQAIGLKLSIAAAYQENLLSGKYLVIVQGNEEEITKSKSVLAIHGTFEALTLY